MALLCSQVLIWVILDGQNEMMQCTRCDLHCWCGCEPSLIPNACLHSRQTISIACPREEARRCQPMRRGSMLYRGQLPKYTPYACASPSNARHVQGTGGPTSLERKLAGAQRLLDPWTGDLAGLRPQCTMGLCACAGSLLPWNNCFRPSCSAQGCAVFTRQTGARTVSGSAAPSACYLGRRVCTLHSPCINQSFKPIGTWLPYNSGAC